MTLSNNNSSTLQESKGLEFNDVRVVLIPFIADFQFSTAGLVIQFLPRFRRVPLQLARSFKLHSGRCIGWA